MRREFAQIGVRIISHALWPLLRRAAADLEGFARSAAAGPETADMKRRVVTKRMSSIDWKSALVILPEIIDPLNISVEFRKRVDINKYFRCICNDFADFCRPKVDFGTFPGWRDRASSTPLMISEKLTIFDDFI